MQIKIELMGNQTSEAGIDKQALIDNVEAEVKKFGETSGAKSRRKDQPAPDGAQGDHHIVQWVIDLATDPKMAPTYARLLLFAVDRILSVAKPSGSRKKAAKRRDKKSEGEESTEKKEVGVFTAMGKTLALPATSAAIEAFLKSLGDHQ